MYKNEEQVGAALAEIFKEGVVKREDMFVTTKLWDSEHAQDAVEPALRESLRKLQLSASPLSQCQPFLASGDLQPDQ